MSNNMYDWVNEKKVNTIGGNCPHECAYCYVPDMIKLWPNLENKYTGEARLWSKAMNGKPGDGTDRPIFVVDMNDLFADAIPRDWILKTLKYLRKYPHETYLLQSKNPRRFLRFDKGKYPPKVIFGTTIESNRAYRHTRAPSVQERAEVMGKIKQAVNGPIQHSTMVNIEPIMAFDLEELLKLIEVAAPDFVSVGADSKSKGLEEPTTSEVKALLRELNDLTEVRPKPNLSRLLKRSG